MNIELCHLRYLVAVIEELHFGRAAARLNISQPSLSQQIQILEQQTGVRLFARTNRSVGLTTTGRRFLVDSRQILAQVDDTAARAVCLHRGEAGELRIGFTSSAPFIKAVSNTLSIFRQRYPDVHALTRETNIHEQIVPLSEGVLDLGLLRNTQLPDTLAWGQVLHEPLLAMVPADHPLARQPSVNLAALARESLTFFDPYVGTGLYSDILGLLRRCGHIPMIIQEAEEAVTVIGLVAAGLGVSILPAFFQRVQLSKMCWLPIDEQDAMSEMQLVRSKYHGQGALAKRFRESLLAWKTEHNQDEEELEVCSKSQG